MSAYSVFPTTVPITYPFERKAETATIVSEFESGVTQARAKWSRPRYSYALTFETLTETEKNTLTAFYETVQGPATAFLFADPEDGPVTGEAVGTGDGVETDFSLASEFVDATTLAVTVNSVAQTEGADFTLDDDAGTISFVVAPTSGHAIEAGYSFRRRVRFKGDEFNVARASYGRWDASAEFQEVRG